MTTRNQKAARQLLQIDRFFTGDFTVRGKSPAPGNPPSSDSPSSCASQPAEQSNTVPHPDPENGMAEIARQIAHCTKCTLAQTRKHVVPGEGNPRPQIVFVGEAPGEDEDLQGRPFVGRAGQLLEKIIIAMGLRRQDVFICNILKCRPPGNRDPKPDEIEVCSPYLQRQLEILSPKIIVALGSHAAKTLLDTNMAIGKLRGRFHDYYFSPCSPPIKLMPTYHPAYILRNYTAETRGQVWDDMRQVLKELGLPIPKSSG